MDSTATVEIDRPIDQVYELTLRDSTKWSSLLVEDEVISDKSNGGVGTTFRCVTLDRGRRMEFQGTVVKHNPPHGKTIKLIGSSFDLDVEYLFEDLRGRTKVTQNSSVQGKGFVKLIFFCMGWFMKKSSCQAAQKELMLLKKYCESFEPEL